MFMTFSLWILHHNVTDWQDWPFRTRNHWKYDFNLKQIISITSFSRSALQNSTWSTAWTTVNERLQWCLTICFTYYFVARIGWTYPLNILLHIFGSPALILQLSISAVKPKSLMTSTLLQTEGWMREIDQWNPLPSLDTYFNNL